jgi:zinc carboxypeptidase/chitobiase/beta-hexosaminidase-like protein
MRSRGTWRLRFAVAAFALSVTGVAGADDGESRGIDPNQGRSLVEITLPSKADALRLQLGADRYGIEFNDHYLRTNRDGTVTVTVFGTDEELARLERGGYELGATIEGPATWRARAAEREAAIRAERKAGSAARSHRRAMQTHTNEIVVLRVDYFESYAGRFLSVEAKDRQGGAATSGGAYVGPTLSLSFNGGAGTPIDSPPREMNTNIDPDTTPDTYIEHRELVRIGAAGTTSPAAPTMIRIGSSTGAAIEAPVNVWLGGGLPPMKDTFQKDFSTHYMDPEEVYTKLGELAAEFPDLTDLITLPNKTNGYQRRAQATMSGTANPGNAVNGATAQSQAVVLTSRAWGHEGGNEITAEFRNPLAANQPLNVQVTGKAIVVSLATGAAGELTSTAAQVVQAINANTAASQLVAALTYRGNAGAGIVQPRFTVSLSDFLDPAVPHGPFEYSVLRIGKHLDGKHVGVFLYCQQHAREWATPLTCLETAEQLLRNYGTDKKTKELVDHLDIFILPSSNPDGANYSMHNFGQQRRNMTNYCAIGGSASDDPFATGFGTGRTNPATGNPYTNTDPASRNAWGVDLNRNNTVGTLFDGYIGASTSCTSDVYAGPDEATEPEIRNELWVADTFKNIKFSNNIHSFGGYFMWAPGTYLPDRSEGEAVHANIGIEKYFFEAGDRILNRIRDSRGTVILPERTGPVADVLYSAAGNSADEHWYRRGVIAYSFETGADLFVNTTLTQPAAAGATGVRVQNRGYDIGDQVTIDAGTASEETRTIATISPNNPPQPNPNMTFTAPLSFAHAVGAVMSGGTLQSGVGFQPDYATEGKPESLEFAAGNYGLLESALAYSKDHKPPEVTMTGPKSSTEPIETTFEWVDEPSVIRYTTDGSKPDESSTLWDSTGPREPGEVFHVATTTEFKWIATDIRGNVSHGKQKFTIKAPKP